MHISHPIYPKYLVFFFKYFTNVILRHYLIYIVVSPVALLIFQTYFSVFLVNSYTFFTFTMMKSMNKYLKCSSTVVDFLLSDYIGSDLHYNECYLKFKHIFSVTKEKHSLFWYKNMILYVRFLFFPLLDQGHVPLWLFWVLLIITTAFWRDCVIFFLTLFIFSLT